jgi:hypothetical protein
VAGLGIGIAWFGYAVLYYGITQIKGDNYGFLDLIVPGRWAKASATQPDQAQAGASAAQTGAAGLNVAPGSPRTDEQTRQGLGISTQPSTSFSSLGQIQSGQAFNPANTATP